MAEVYKHLHGVYLVTACKERLRHKH